VVFTSANEFQSAFDTIRNQFSKGIFASGLLFQNSRNLGLLMTRIYFCPSSAVKSFENSYMILSFCVFDVQGFHQIIRATIPYRPNNPLLLISNNRKTFSNREGAVKQIFSI
jgi:hypothetical protein